MAIKIMVDSAADINEKEAQSLGIYMVPMTITFGQVEYLDGVNLQSKEFYEKLIESTIMPKTSQINAFRFEEEFAKHTENGDELIVITISSKLSGTYNSAMQAAEKFKDKVFVVDSLNACVGERLLVQYAQKLISEGKNIQEILDTLNEPYWDYKDYWLIAKELPEVKFVFAHAGGYLINDFIKICHFQENVYIDFALTHTTLGR